MDEGIWNFRDVASSVDIYCLEHLFGFAQVVWDCHKFILDNLATFVGIHRLETFSTAKSRTTLAMSNHFTYNREKRY